MRALLLLCSQQSGGSSTPSICCCCSGEVYVHRSTGCMAKAVCFLEVVRENLAKPPEPQWGGFVPFKQHSFIYPTNKT